jgi:hypothetical protein
MLENFIPNYHFLHRRADTETFSREAYERKNHKTLKYLWCGISKIKKKTWPYPEFDEMAKLMGISKEQIIVTYVNISLYYK